MQIKKKHLTFDKKFRIFYIWKGYNNIEFVALNEGESSPNTAQLSVFDENGVNLSNNKWLITTGYKARLVVFKK